MNETFIKKIVVNNLKQTQSFSVRIDFFLISKSDLKKLYLQYLYALVPRKTFMSPTLMILQPTHALMSWMTF